MNIAILIPSLAGGGAERAAQTIGGHFFNRGHNVYYFLLDSGLRDVYDVQGTVIQTGIKCYASFPDTNGKRHIEWLGTIAKLRALKKQYHIDTAISFMEEYNSFNVLSKGKERVIVSVRTSLSAYRNESVKIVQPDWIRKTYQKADGIVAVSRYVKDELIRDYKIKARVCVIPNPAIRHDKATEQRKLWEWGEKAVVFVGRLNQVKQPDRAIRIFSYVLERERDARLIMLGEGPLREYLEKLCEKYGIANEIEVVGFTDDLGYYHRNAKVFLMTSILEGFPNAMVEAMSYGVPIVTMDSPGGCGEIVGKESGFFETQHCRYGILTPHIAGKPKWSEPLSTEEVATAEAVLEVLNNDETYEYYHRQSLKRSKYYSLDKTMGCWERVIEK